MGNDSNFGTGTSITGTSAQTHGDAQEPLGVPKRAFTYGDVRILASELVTNVCRMFPRAAGERFEFVYGVPTGGSVVAPFVVEAFDYNLQIVSEVPLFAHNTLVIDDVCDTGKTLERYLAAGATCAVLVRSRPIAETRPEIIAAYTKYDLEYVVFPWEGNIQGPEDAVRRILTYLGYDPDEPSLRDTPRRVLSWYDEFRDHAPEFTATKFEGVSYSGMVVVRDIPFVSLCEHHLLPFTGTVTLAYIPPISGEILGLSKLARLVQHEAKKLQVQERLTEHIVTALTGLTGSDSAAVLVTAEHLCMSYRGPKVPGHTTVTSSLRGQFYDSPTVRAEWLTLARV
jgi:GTP cyclohydrolase IA